MDFVRNADIYSVNGEKIGRLDRVVLDPKTREVTYLVAKEGFLFQSDKLIPIEMVKDVVEDRVVLQENEETLEALPSYQDEYYVPLAQENPDLPFSVYWYPPVGARWGGGGYFGPRPAYIRKREKHIPEDQEVINEGAEVISKDGKSVGNVEEVITEPTNDQVTHIVIEEGLLFTEKKLLPVTWIEQNTEMSITLSITADVLERLPEYSPEV